MELFRLFFFVILYNKLHFLFQFFHFCCGWNRDLVARTREEADADEEEETPRRLLSGRSDFANLFAASARAASAASARACCWSSPSAAAAAAAAAASGSLKTTPKSGPFRVWEPRLSLAGGAPSVKGSSVALAKRSTLAPSLFVPAPPAAPAAAPAFFFFWFSFFFSAAKSRARTERGACEAAREEVV